MLFWRKRFAKIRSLRSQSEDYMQIHRSNELLREILLLRNRYLYTEIPYYSKMLACQRGHQLRLCKLACAKLESIVNEYGIV